MRKFFFILKRGKIVQQTSRKLKRLQYKQGKNETEDYTSSFNKKVVVFSEQKLKSNKQSHYNHMSSKVFQNCMHYYSFEQRFFMNFLVVLRRTRKADKLSLFSPMTTTSSIGVWRPGALTIRVRRERHVIRGGRVPRRGHGTRV